MTWWRAGTDRAASEVVGYVLVTGITVTAITIVLLTSGPALEEVQSAQQRDSMLRFFGDLDQGISQLLSGAPAGATPIWRVSIADGHIEVEETAGHMWAYAVDTATEGQLVYRGFADRDDTFTIHNDGSSSLSDIQMRARVWVGSSKTDIAATAGTSSLGAGAETQVSLEVPLEGRTISVSFHQGDPDDNDAFARVWFVDGAAMLWERPGARHQRILYQNMGIIAEQGDAEVMHNHPRIRAPEETSNGEHVFLRILKLDGTVSVGGQQTAEILLSSHGSHPRHSASDVDRIQIYPPTSTATAWERFFTACELGYTYSWDDDPSGSGSADAEAVAFRDKVSAPCGGQTLESQHGSDAELAVTFVQTLVEASLRGGV